LPHILRGPGLQPATQYKHGVLFPAKHKGAVCVQMRTSQTFLRDTTVTSPLALLLFGGQLEVVHGEGYVLVDGWIQIRAAAPTAVLVQRLRGGLDTLLQQRIKQPGLDWGAQAGELINTIIKLLQDEEATRQRER